MTISHYIQPSILVLIGFSFLFAMLFVLLEYINLRALKKSQKKSQSLNNTKKTMTEGVSVIIYADNDALSLDKNLPIILAQDYPLYEVIVVCNGKNDSSIDVVEKYAQTHSNLHYSFTPNDARNLSRKKLALMIGIKAAAFDIILTTNSNCTPTTQWISSMVRHFADGAKVVIGHSIPTGHNSQLSAYQNFITQENCVQYLSQAITGKPYRGTSNNLAYSKELFFQNKGFSHSMHLHHGEDDLFVNEITTKTNTHVELSTESTVVAEYDYVRHEFRSEKLRRNFTERMIRSIAFPINRVKDILPVASTLVALVALYFGYTNWIAIASVALLLILSVTLHLIIKRKVYRIINISDISAFTPLFTLVKPITEMYYRMKSRRHTTYNYTWQPLHK